MSVEEIEDLIGEYGNILYKFCIKLTQNKEDAEDLYQQTFLKATELRHKINKNSSPKSFLLSISIKLWKNNIRKNNRRNFIAPTINIDEHEHLEIKDTSFDIELDLLHTEEKNYVNRAIENLKDKYKIVIIMYYTADMSIDEISKSLIIPKGTVKSRLHKARNLIKDELEAIGYERKRC
ncbi:RNA polymerase sigma factor [Paraclostridium sordellii]|uniref:RNA polymerase sigma factor n=1 Tax=Paraclostridium sordellii TaxID=1505 RepID=UPI0005E9FD71|nr:RNA polymerase sigma factor [Paeniclostridium sordellii]CEQ18106.1 RNA polymerase factor sigma-70 RpoD [[Clostridium] sordellii] [Paeniclostridium sordellii]